MANFTPPPPEKRSRWTAAGGDLLVTAVAVLLLAAAFAGKEPSPYLFPRILAVLLLLLCLLQLVIVLYRADVSQRALVTRADLMSALPAVAAIVIYVALAERLGFYLAALPAFFAFVLVGAGALSLRRVALAAVVAVIFVALLYVFFSQLLQVQTPRGIWF